MPDLARDFDLRQAARSALLRHYHITPSRLVRVAHRHNDVFRVDTQTGNRYVLRIQNQTLTDAQVRSQQIWLAALTLEQNLVRVPKPVPAADGEAFARIAAPGGQRRIVLMQWLPGSVARTRGPRIYSKAARMIAQLHLHAVQFRPPRGYTCRSLGADWLFGSGYFARHVNRRRRRVAAMTEQVVRATMESLGRGREDVGVIHADLNLSNIIFHRGEPSPIDFDEFGRGWFLFDIAELIRTSINLENYAQRKAMAIKAYSAVRPLGEEQIVHFDGFAAATFVQYLNWAFEHARNVRDLRWVGFCIDVLQMLAKPR